MEQREKVVEIRGLEKSFSRCSIAYNSSKGTEGVGRAANAAVVMAMFLIFIEELLVLQLVNAIRGM